MDSASEIATLPTDSETAKRIRALEDFVGELTLLLDDACRRLDRRDRIDALSGLANRRAVMELLDEAWDEDRTGETPLSVLLVDVDGLAHVNDAFGPPAGDRALQHVARVMASTLRTDDVAGRLIGDEFLVILPATPLAGALRTAEKIRAAVTEEFLAFDGGFWQASVSIGAAERLPGLDSPQALVEAASRGLTTAKTEGRGRWASAQAPGA
ncbi:MAG: GGDEF domain-containing protein [Betaproteobacteria bacterium]|nr:GGDEF domain-containing protein [Betaproteobacteria bacterium]